MTIIALLISHILSIWTSPLCPTLPSNPTSTLFAQENGSLVYTQLKCIPSVKSFFFFFFPGTADHSHLADLLCMLQIYNYMPGTVLGAFYSLAPSLELVQKKCFFESSFYNVRDFGSDKQSNLSKFPSHQPQRQSSHQGWVWL